MLNKQIQNYIKFLICLILWVFQYEVNPYPDASKNISSGYDELLTKV